LVETIRLTMQALHDYEQIVSRADARWPRETGDFVMAQLAFATARSDFSTSESFVRQPVRGTAPRRAQPAGRGSVLVRQVVTGLLVVALLVLIDLAAAHVLDSQLLGFVFADLVFLVGVALRSAVAGSRRSRGY
jgi:hypothetical protein